MISAKYILFFTLLSAFANTNPSYYGANEECRED